MNHQPNKELSTGLYPIKEPTQQELLARSELNHRMSQEAEGLDARVAKIEEDAAALKAMRSQPIAGPEQSREIRAHIDQTYERESAEILSQIKQLARQPESA